MRNNLKVIGYTTCVIFVLLWLNQLFSGINLYKLEKSQWQKYMDSIVETSVDSYLKLSNSLDSSGLTNDIDFNPQTFTINIQTRDTVHTICIDSNETLKHAYIRKLLGTSSRELAPLSRLDTLLHLSLGKQSVKVQLITCKLDSTSNEIERFPLNDTDISGLIRSKIYSLGSQSGESIEIYYNFQAAIFLTKAWNNVLAIAAFTLLLIFGLLYLSRIQQQLSRLQEKMIQQVVHDWKTPLNNIGTLAQLLEKKSISPEDEKGIKKIQIIQQEIELLRTSSQQLLKTLSGIARLQINKNEFNLKTELSLLLEKLQNANLNQKNIHVQLRYLVQYQNIHASHFHLLGAIQNLLDNAVKYGGNEPRITVTCYQKRGTLVIQVKDDGPGIPKKEQKHIFDKYYQVNTNENPGAKKGYGLGLTYVRNVVKAHGGSLSLNSTPGNGCTFTIKLKKWRTK